MLVILFMSSGFLAPRYFQSFEFERKMIPETLVDHELLTLPEHLNSSQFLVGFVLFNL